MKTISKKDNEVRIIAEIEESLANAIRRYVNQIPILAVDEVDISKNDSPLYDETLAHRIGLIPLKMNKLVSEKTGNSLKLSTKKEGVVYSNELTGGLDVVYEKIPITSLKKGQELEFVAKAKFGKGADHSKFSPGLIFYRDIVDVKVDKNCPKEIVGICPRKILKSDNGRIVVEDSYKCDMCEACSDLCKKEEKGSVEFVPTKELMISIESFGQLKTEEILSKAIEFLKKDLVSISKEISKIK